MNNAIAKSTADDRVRGKDLGYSSSHPIKMYGKRFEIVSHPSQTVNGIAVHVTTAKQPTRRTLRLPTSILVGLKDSFPEVV